MFDEKVQKGVVPSHDDVTLEKIQGSMKDNQLSSPEATRMQDEKMQKGDVTSYEETNLEQMQGFDQKIHLSRPKVIEVLDKEVQTGEIDPTIVQDASSNGKMDHPSITESSFQNTSQEMDDEYRVIHYEIDDSQMEHKDSIDEDLLDVFNPRDPEDFTMDVNQINRQQGISPGSHLLKSKKGTKQPLHSMPAHIARPFTMSHSYKSSK